MRGWPAHNWAAAAARARARGRAATPAAPPPSPAGAILLRNGPCNAAFFLLREPAHNLLPAAPPVAALSAPLWGSARDFFAGAILGATLSSLFFPVNMAKSVMQLQIGGRFRGIAETIAQVHAERKGLAGLYRGVGGNALRAFVSWGIVNASYELIKNADHRRRQRAAAHAI